MTEADPREMLKRSLILNKKLEQEISELKQASEETIAIIGMSCRFPGGANNPEEFWNLLHRGGDGITEVPASRWDADSFYDSDPTTPGKMITKLGGFLDIDVSLFDADFFGISPREAEFMDPQQRLLLELSYESLESANIEPSTLRGTETGVFIGMFNYDYLILTRELDEKVQFNPFIGTGNVASAAAGRISFVFDFQGPNFAIDTACSSSLVAIDQACESLRNGSSNLALAGGVNLILAPYASIAASKANMLSPDGHCKTFDASANGYVRGEGCGIIVLKRYSEAVRDGNPILAVIKSSGVNQDGASSGLTVPNGEAQENLINTVLAKARLKGSDIDYVEAHGTGTSLGDPIEVGAIKSTYGIRDKTHPLRLGSVKTNIGHLEGAAGVAGVIKSVLALQKETIPPNLHFHQLNPYVDMNFPVEVVTENLEWKRGEKPRRAAVSSFGFSGTNAHLIIEEAPLNAPVSVQPKIPVRQFQRKRYWLKGAIPGGGSKRDFVHPLLGEMHKSPTETISFFGSLQLSALPYLKNHKICDYNIYPIAGYIEMMLAAARYGLGEGIIELTKVSIESALNLPTSTKIDTQVLLTSTNSGNKVAVYTQSKSGAWNNHAKGIITVKDIEQNLNSVDIEALKACCTVAISKEEFYTKVNLNQNYGNSFQTVELIYVGSQEVFGELKVDVSTKGYLAYPPLLEGCFQLGVKSLVNENSKELYLPLDFDSLEFYAPLEDHIFVHWKETEINDLGRSGNLKIVSPSGKLLVMIQGLNYRKTTEHELKKELANQLSVDDWMYKWVWQEHTSEPIKLPLPLGHFLILGRNEIAQTLIEIIESKGGTCHSISQTELPITKEDYVALLDKENPSAIVHLSHPTKVREFTSEDITLQTFGLKSFLNLIQALTQLNYKIPLFLINEVNLINSPLNGLFKTVSLENPEVVMKHILLGINWDPELLLNLLFAKENEMIFKLDEGKIYVQRLARDKEAKSKQEKLTSSLEDRYPNEITFRADATYLITGDLTTLSSDIAQWLMTKGVKHLVLAGKKTNNLDLFKSPEFGEVELTYESLDSSNEEAVAILITRLSSSSNPLKGIFYLDSLLDDGPLNKLDWSHSVTVFDPKIYSSYYLHKYSKDLDFFVMFSSVASVLGNPGLRKYAAANTFMDALCEYRKEQGLPALSLSWDPRAQFGMANDPSIKAGMIELKPKEVMLALEAALLKSDEQLTIANINWKNFLKHLNKIPSWLERFAEKTAGRYDLSKQLESIHIDNRFNFIKEFVSFNVKDVLGISPSRSIDSSRSFTSMGMDSMLAVELKNKLQSGIGKESTLAIAALFEHSSIEKLTQYIAQILNIQKINAPEKTIRTISSVISSSKWIVKEPSKAKTRLRVFCFPGAGSGPTVFKGWQKKLPSDVELNIIQLPGREDRYDEQFLSDFKQVVFGIVYAIIKYLDTPYVFFGNSMGCIISCEVVKELQTMHLPLPEHIILSVPFRQPYLHGGYEPYEESESNEEDYLKSFVNSLFGGRKLTDNELEYIKHIIPISRADFKMVNDYKFLLDEPLPVPITSIYCKDDAIVSEDDIKGWSIVTKETYRYHTIPGVHGELGFNPTPFIDILNSVLNQVSNRS